jgi:formylglycine-generating enzyme required for sulfatase activity
MALARRLALAGAACGFGLLMGVAFVQTTDETLPVNLDAPLIAATTSLDPITVDESALSIHTPSGGTGSAGPRESPPVAATTGEVGTSLPLATLLEGKQAGEKQWIPDLDTGMSWCPPGTFRMGIRAPSTVPQHLPLVTLTRGFWIGTTEVTQRLWEDVMKTRPWEGQQHAMNHPAAAASYISFYDAVEFCDVLTNRRRAAGQLSLAWRFCLPTEAQWEYACRAGTEDRHGFGNEINTLGDFGWWGGMEGGGNTREEPLPHAVGLKRANTWGLYDTHGNVGEWCVDRFSRALPGGLDPVVLESELPSRLCRGGHWASGAWHTDAGWRAHAHPATRRDGHGFRLTLQREEGAPPATPTETPEDDSDARRGVEAFLSSREGDRTDRWFHILNRHSQKALTAWEQKDKTPAMRLVQRTLVRNDPSQCWRLGPLEDNGRGSLIINRKDGLCLALSLASRDIVLQPRGATGLPLWTVEAREGFVRLRFVAHGYLAIPYSSLEEDTNAIHYFHLDLGDQEWIVLPADRAE